MSSTDKNSINHNRICKGNGECLKQIDIDVYEYMYECEFKCVAQKCPNFIVCHEKYPECIGECCDGLCANCDSSYGRWKGGPGILTFSVQEIECPICFENSITNVKLPNCDHYICVSCFRVFSYGLPIPQPPFPYNDEIWTLYEELGINNPRFINDELIHQWEHDCNEHEERINVSNRECPLCRSSIFDFKKV